MKNKLSALLTCFRENYNTQHCLVSMIENWKNTLDKSEFAAIFLHFPKTFNTDYRFLEDALTSMKSYLSKRLQKVRVK